MAVTRDSMEGTPASGSSLTTQAAPDVPDSFLSTLADYHPESGDTSQPLSHLYRADSELRSLLLALPTKADIVALIGMVEVAHRKELGELKTELKGLSSRLAKGESSLSALDHRVAALAWRNGKSHKQKP